MYHTVEEEINDMNDISDGEATTNYVNQIYEVLTIVSEMLPEQAVLTRRTARL